MDKIAPYKIEKRPKSQQCNMPRKLQISKLNKTKKTPERSSDNKIVEQKPKNESIKPNFCFKLGCQKYDPIDNPETEKILRNTKIEQ